MLAGTPPPFLDGFFVKPKSLYDRFQRTTPGQQRDHQHHRLGIGPQAIEDRALRIRKRFLALVADVALFNLTMDTDIAFSYLAPCVTVDVGAKYLLWVHWLLSVGVMTIRVCQ
jgi:hypothetical protein